ncbi:dihydrofolate reductase [Salinicoccus siamensis]|uniref:Dihydrofolate reductase n=2 Tax=Salinicoccus siamensis TaxID=381830 RepID=A0ABV5Z202_9STAP
MIAYVWAEDEDKVIGRDGKLPWHLPADMAFFKKVTLQGDIVMGRRTYETIPKRPLPGRRNIVLTSNQDYEAPGALVVHSKEDALALGKEYGDDLYIIGGASLFKMFEEDVDILYRTRIHAHFKGDTHFPQDFGYGKFECIRSEAGPVDDKNKYAHTYEVWRRKNR